MFRKKSIQVKEVDPKHQFSKKLAGRTEWFWFFYLVIMVALLAYQPEIGVVAVYLSLIPTVVMGISIVAYTKNSITEKIILAMLDKTKLELSLKSSASTSSTIAKAIGKTTTSPS